MSESAMAPTQGERSRGRIRTGLRLAHLLATILFMGGILGCVVLNATGHLDDLSQYATRRSIASDLVWFLIVPGLVALPFTGMALSRLDGTGLPRRDRIALKQILSLLLLANGLFLLVPRVVRIDSILQTRQCDMIELAALQRGEDWLGGANFVLGLAAIAISASMTGIVSKNIARRP